MIYTSYISVDIPYTAVFVSIRATAPRLQAPSVGVQTY